MSALIIRFLVGGIIVSLFASLGDVLGPKSFAGLFGAAPSVALATIGLTVRQQGVAYAATEARSMIFGACAFLVYAALVSWLIRRYRFPALLAAMTFFPVWFGVSLGLWFVIGERL